MEAGSREEALAHDFGFGFGHGARASRKRKGNRRTQFFSPVSMKHFLRTYLMPGIVQGVVSMGMGMAEKPDNSRKPFRSSELTCFMVMSVLEIKCVSFDEYLFIEKICAKLFTSVYSF